MPDGASTERDMLCRSRDQWSKEGAMWDRPIERLPEQCAKRDWQLQKQAVREAGPVKRRMGKWWGHAPAAVKLFTVTVRRDEQQRVCGLEVREQKERLAWARQAHGAYLLQTSHPAADPAELRRWYEQLTQAEAGFGSMFSQKRRRVPVPILGMLPSVGVLVER